MASPVHIFWKNEVVRRHERDVLEIRPAHSIIMPPRAIPIPPSTQIASVAYDDKTMELTVVFQRGGAYLYMGVPSDLVDGWTHAFSAGAYFREFIKDQFEYAR